MPKRVVSGIVTSDKMSKTRRVEINRLVKHPKYKKYVRRRTICYAHDEANESGTGDRVEIIESEPLSKLKRWRLVRVLEKSTDVDVAALEQLGKLQRKRKLLARLLPAKRSKVEVCSDPVGASQWNRRSA